MENFFKGLFGLLFATVLIGTVCGICYGLNWCGEAASVAQHELGANALLSKYMMLKEMHAQLDKKKADIKVYQARIQGLESAYLNKSRAYWARDDREQYNVWSSEVAGIKASYNDLAAQYNAKMAEVNWKFSNIGELPQGATEPLPRNYAPYLEN